MAHHAWCVLLVLAVWLPYEAVPVVELPDAKVLRRAPSFPVER